MNKQNKRKLYTFRHMWIRQALKPANDTRDQELNYANNIKWNTYDVKVTSRRRFDIIMTLFLRRVRWVGTGYCIQFLQNN